MKMPQIQTLVINQDNGPENKSSRTQFMKRLVEFAQFNQPEVQLAYYPPYHSKYNPIERVWAALEHHWNGSLLEEVDTAVQFAQTMSFTGKTSRRLCKLGKVGRPTKYCLERLRLDARRLLYLLLITNQGTLT